VLEGAPYILGLGGEMGAARGVVNPGKAAQDAVTGAATSVGRRLTQPAPAFAGELPPTQAPVPEAAATAAAPVKTASPNRNVPPATDPDNVPGSGAATPPKFEAATPAGVAVEAPADPAAEAQRAATLQQIGLQEARESAITGDKKAAAGDYQQSKLDNEGGKVLSDTFANERAALDNHADKLVAEAGGSTGLDETSLHNRGSTILQPLNDLSDHLDAKIKDLYSQADAKAQGLPLELSNTSKVLANRPEFIGTTEGQQLLRGASAYLRQAGVMDDAGTLGSATVQQAERFKQYLNNQWSPRTSRLIRTMKDAIDDDVTQSAGGDVYQEARQTRALRAHLLDDPQGVASLLESSGPEGINRQVKVERVPDAVARMPVDQFSHVIDTLNGVPAELRPQANAALSEIRTQFLLRMLEQAQKLKGSWNNRGVSQYLNNSSAKLAKVFSPAELRQIKLLNDAGNVLDVDRSYPGAAVQGHNLAARGAMLALEHGAVAAGSHLGPLGAMAGKIVGGAGANAINSSLSKSAARKRIRKLK